MDAQNAAQVAKDLLQQIAVFSTIVSVMVFGIKATIKTIMKKGEEEKLHRAIGLSLTYAFGLIFGFLIKNEYLAGWYFKAIIGISVGTLAVAMYKSVVRSLLKVIPKLMEKFLGVK